MTTVLFDLDGTIIDPFVGLAASYRAAARATGYDDLSDDYVRTLIGPPIQDVFISWGLGEIDQREAVDAFRAYYRSQGIGEYSVYEGMKLVLDALSAHSALGIATSKPRTFALEIIEREGWTSRFAFVSGAELDGTRRLKAEVIEHAMTALRCTPDACWMVGDRREDIAGARAVGMRSIGVTWGYGTVEELQAADAIAGSPEQLIPLLKLAMAPGATGGAKRSSGHAGSADDPRGRGQEAAVARRVGSASARSSRDLSSATKP